MTTYDMTPQERALRDRLHAEIVPPPMPDRLGYAIDRLAEGEMDRSRLGLWARLSTAGASRWGRAAIAFVAILAIAGGSLLLGASIRQRSQVAGTPIPTLPAMTQPSLPPDAAAPTGANGRWFDANSAYLMGVDANDVRPTLMETRDGGQTWRQTGTLSAGGMLGAEMLDLDHGYTGDIVLTGGSDNLATGFRLSVDVTADGGATWAHHEVGEVASPPFAGSWADVHFADPQHGVVLASTMSPDPGENVQQVWCPAFGTNGKGETCNRIPLVCVGFSSDDGGASWHTLDGVPCIGLGGVHWFTPALGISTGLDQTLFTTIDGGRTWHGATPPGVVDGRSSIAGPSVLTWADASTLRMAGTIAIDGEVIQPMTVWESTDLGASWRIAYTAPRPTITSQPDSSGDVRTNYEASDMWAFDADHWIAIFSAGAEDGGMLETWDGGRSWTNRGGQQVVTGMNIWRWADRLHGMTQGGSWICGGEGPDVSCHMQGQWLITNDGGQTWHQSPF